MPSHKKLRQNFVFYWKKNNNITTNKNDVSVSKQANFWGTIKF